MNAPSDVEAEIDDGRRPARGHRKYWFTGGLAALVLIVVVIAELWGAGAGEQAGGPMDSAAAGPVAAFYGDSYTLGTGASSPEKRWSTIVSTERGWIEVNPSVNGLGFVNNRAALDADLIGDIVEAAPDVVIVTMGLNDNFSYDRGPTAIDAAITADFERLKTELPEARIVVVEPFWYTDQRPESLDIIADWVSTGAAAIGADYIAGASRWLSGHPEWMAADGLHPNDVGYAEIAKRMDEELAAIGLS